MNNKQFFQQCWKSELPSTIVALKALTSPEKLGYKPADRNRSAKELVDHFVSHVEDLIEAVETGVMNHRVTANYPNIENAIETFEKGSEKLMKLLDPVDEKTWDEKKTPMLVFGNSFGEKPLGATCWMFLFDLIHHRGQLSTYYRPMGLVQPSIYGPTSEMVEKMMADRSQAN
ncbi:MAG: DinB family protein [Ferruginibacter sp.]